MIVIANSSPLIALGRLQMLEIFRDLFGKIHIPDMVYNETVSETSIDIQKESILKAINEGFIEVRRPTKHYDFCRKLDEGEKAVLNLAFDMSADLLIIDEKKARNEAKKLSFRFGTVPPY